MYSCTVLAAGRAVRLRDGEHDSAAASKPKRRQAEETIELQECIQTRQPSVVW